MTAFQSAEVLAAFTVTGVVDSVDLTWTVTHGGATSTATARAALNLPCTEAPPPDPDVPIGLFVTCVVNHGATYDAVFRYESTKPDAETIPVGDSNFFSPGNRDRGQPETFLPGVHNEAVVVRGIPSSVDLTWTVWWIGSRSAIATPRFEQKCEEAAGQLPTPPPTPSPDALPIGVFAVCVTNHGSHFDAMFGYVNENSEVVSVPIGSDNAVCPGPAGQGQPEAFHPGFADRVFTVHGVSASNVVTWTVRVGNQVRVATATADFPHKCLTAPPDPVASASVRKSARPRTVIVGEHVGFTISVRNTGSAVLRPGAGHRHAPRQPAPGRVRDQHAGKLSRHDRRWFARGALPRAQSRARSVVHDPRHGRGHGGWVRHRPRRRGRPSWECRERDRPHLGSAAPGRHRLTSWGAARVRAAS